MMLNLSDTYLTCIISFLCCSVVTDPVSVQISPLNAVPSLNQSLDLVCHDTRSGPLSGPSQLVVWYKDGQKVILGENMQLLHNTSLHFDSLLPSDAGFYQCQSYAPTEQHTGVYSLGYLLTCKYSVSDEQETLYSNTGVNLLIFYS